jgi:hypothetical protein
MASRGWSFVRYDAHCTRWCIVLPCGVGVLAHLDAVHAADILTALSSGDPKNRPAQVGEGAADVDLARPRHRGSLCIGIALANCDSGNSLLLRTVRLRLRSTFYLQPCRLADPRLAYRVLVRATLGDTSRYGAYRDSQTISPSFQGVLDGNRRFSDCRPCHRSCSQYSVLGIRTICNGPRVERRMASTHAFVPARKLSHGGLDYEPRAMLEVRRPAGHAVRRGRMPFGRRHPRKAHRD